MFNLANDLERRNQGDGICKLFITCDKETVQRMLLKCFIVDEHRKTMLLNIKEEM